MTVSFCKETENVYRLCVPFDNIYTSVFLIRSGEDAMLIDCASTAYDVDRIIVPALEKLGYELGDIKALVLSHKHEDHAGGLERILELSPSIEIIRDVREITNDIRTYPMAGHTLDCIGVLDLREGTLISVDGLQGAGVDKYRCSLKSEDEYLNTLQRIQNDERIKNVLFSHDYEPWNANQILGRENVLDCLEECKKYVKKR